MALEGTVVNGAVVLDNGTPLPEGARVRLELIDDTSFMDDWPDMTDPSLPPDHPCAPYDRETELAILRQSIEDMKAGRGGMTLEQFEAEFAKEFKLPPVPRE